MKVPRRKILSASPWQRRFSATARRREIRDIKELPDSNRPRYQETRNNDLLSLQWPAPPRNILLVKKDCVPAVTASLIEFANHVHSTYLNLSLILEPHVASSIHSSLPFPIYTTPTPTSSPNSSSTSTSPSLLHTKVDLITTLGGDGTILHASSLFSTTRRVPPILSFSMGTLGFLSEWKFAEHKRAFREVYMSGAGVGDRSVALGAVESKPQAFDEHVDCIPARSGKGGLTGWSSVRGKLMGSQRGAKVLLRNRLKVGVFDATGEHMKDPTTTFSSSSSASSSGYTYAMNEAHIHRGALPHLAIVQVFVGGRFLTEAVADGIIVSTPTGSTAYSLSSGGSIIHPLVSSLLLTPICPRSLSFRPLVLPANTPVVLRLSEKNRGREVEVSVDGVRRGRGVGVGMEVRVVGEEVRRVGGKGGMGDAGGQWGGGEWEGGIPCIMRGNAGADANGDDGWVGGLNGLLKFNYPFGEES